MKFYLSLLFISCLFSCSQKGQFSIIESMDKSSSEIQISDQQKTRIKAYYKGTPEEAQKMAQFILQADRVFQKWGDSQNNEPLVLEAESNVYRLFFSIGGYCLSDWKNEVLKQGLIQTEWNQWLLDKDDLGFLAQEKNRPVRIDDFENFFVEFKWKESDQIQIYPYLVYYLLKEVLFVSIQEFLARPERYYNINEIDSVFSQMVILPESAEFFKFILKKYGKAMAVKLGKSSYSPEEWKRLSGEEMHDMEEEFTKSLENHDFKGVYQDQVFLKKLNDLLRIYNKMTKPTLFRK